MFTNFKKSLKHFPPFNMYKYLRATVLKNFQNEITFYFRCPFISSRAPWLRDPWRLDSDCVRETKRASRKRKKERL